MSRHALIVTGLASLGLLVACRAKETPPGASATTGSASAGTLASTSTSTSTSTEGLSSVAASASSARSTRGPNVTLADLDALRDELPESHARAHSEGDPLPQLVFRQITGGADQFCGAHTSGAIRCWGATFWSQLVGGYTQVAAGDAFFCALDRAGAIICAPDSAPRYTPPVSAASASSSVGSAASGAPPVTSAAPASASASASAVLPPPPFPVGKFRSIVAAGARVCVLDDAGKAICWGETKGCATGTPPDQGGFRKIAVGDCHACAVDAKGAVSCWGTPERPSLAVPEGLVAREIAAGKGFACAVDTKNALVCWGKPPSLPDDLPTEIDKLGAREDHACVVAKNGALRCWGATGTTEAGPFQSVAVSNRGVCGHLDKDKIACFGQATQGQLDVPIDTTKRIALDGGGTKEQQEEKKKRRSALFEELWAKLPPRPLPITFDRKAQLPAGGVVDERFLPVIMGTQLHETFSRSTFHYGFRLESEGPGRLVVLYDDGDVVLRSFDENGVRLGSQTVMSSRVEAFPGWRFNDNRAIEEQITETTLGADRKGESTRQKTFEIFDLTTTEGNRHFCRIKRATSTFAVDKNGGISGKSGNMQQVSEKYGSEGCSSAWLGGDARRRRATTFASAEFGGGGW